MSSIYKTSNYNEASFSSYQLDSFKTIDAAKSNFD